MINQNILKTSQAILCVCMCVCRSDLHIVDRRRNEIYKGRDKRDSDNTIWNPNLNKTLHKLFHSGFQWSIAHPANKLYDKIIPSTETHFP